MVLIETGLIEIIIFMAFLLYVFSLDQITGFELFTSEILYLLSIYFKNNIFGIFCGKFM